MDNVNGTHHNPARRILRFTRAEEDLLRELNRKGLPRAEIAKAMHGTRPAFSAEDVGNWRSRRGLTHGRTRGRRRPAATATEPATTAKPAEHTITIQAPRLEPVSFRVTAATTKAVIELLVGV